jgi:hypothetical protein
MRKACPSISEKKRKIRGEEKNEKQAHFLEEKKENGGKCFDFS